MARMCSRSLSGELSSLQIDTAAVYEPLLASARYKGAHGGRGSAKSHFFAGLLIEECIAQRTDAVCLREVQKSLKFSVKKLLENKISSMNAGAYFEVQNEQIKAANGGVIIFQGMQDHTSDSIKSLEDFKIAWFEEAQTASQRSLDLLRPTLRAPGSQLWFSWNPRFATDPIDQLLRGDKPPPDSIVVEATFFDNPWMPQELIDELEYDKRRDPDKYAHIWLGKYQTNASARVFKNWTIEQFEVDPAAVIRQGADWGFSVDPTVLVQAYIVGRRLYIPFEAYRVGCEIVDTPALFMSLPDSEKWPMVADSARPETISHLRKNGFPKITSAIKGAKSVEEGIEFLQSFDIVVHPRCIHLIDELTLYSFKTDPLDESKVLPVLADKDNHVIDALRYALEGARRAANVRTRKPLQTIPDSASWMS